MNSYPGSLRLPVTAAVATVLASVCLGGAFLTGKWFLPSVFAVVLVGGAAELARRMSAPRSLVPFVAMAALLCYLVARYASEQAVLWVVPTQDALHQLATLARSGRTDIERFAAPVGVPPEIEFLTVAGIGLVAVAVDTLAVTWRRAALAGLPLLALYTVPVSVAPGGVGWVAFALGGAGYLALLLAEARERLSRWGRPMRFLAPRANWRGGVETAPLAQVGRRVGAAALGLALVVPAVLPDIDAGTFGFGGGFGPGGGGGSTVSVVNPIIDLGKDLRRDENRPVIRYDGRRTYLRMVSLDEFSGDEWKPSRLKVPRENDVEDGLIPPPGLGAGVERTRQRHEIEVLDLEQQWLPLPYPTLRVDIDGRWVYDPLTFNVFSVNSSTSGLTYKVTSLDVEPTADQLRAAPPPPAGLERYLALPLLPPVVAETAQEVTAGRDSNYDKAVALQDWLRDPTEFTYSTKVSDTIGDASGARAVAAFLSARRGYCVHFASTMAVMARQLGIPARVAVGFTPGDRGGDGRVIVGLHDLHAWPELFFQGTGWVAFEPTPAVRTGPPPAWAQAEAGGPGGPGGNPNALPTEGATSGGGANPRVLERRDIQRLLNSPGGAQPGADPGRPFPVVPILLAFGLLLLALVPATTRLLIRHRRWRRATTPAARVNAAWSELRDTLVDYGYTWPASDPPRRGTARLCEEMELTGEPAESARRLGAATERARYATELGQVGDLRHDVDTVRAAIAAGTTRWGRARARWLPRSTRAVSAALSNRFADGLDALDAAAATVRAKLVPGRRPAS